MGNKHSRTFKTHRKKNNTTLKNRKNMTGGGTWKQIKTGNNKGQWYYELANTAKIGIRNSRSGRVSPFRKKTLDFIDTENEARETLTDQFLKDKADNAEGGESASHIGYIEKGTGELSQDAESNKLDWGFLSSRKKINKNILNKEILGLKLAAVVNKGEWYKNVKMPGNPSKYFYVHKRWKRSDNDIVSDLDITIYGKEPGIGYRETDIFKMASLGGKSELIAADEGSGLIGGGLESDMDMKKGKVPKGTFVICKRGTCENQRGKILSYNKRNKQYSVKFENGITKGYNEKSLKQDEEKEDTEEEVEDTEEEVEDTEEEAEDTEEEVEDTEEEEEAVTEEEGGEGWDALMNKVRIHENVKTFIEAARGKSSQQSNSMLSNLVRVLPITKDPENYNSLFTDAESISGLDEVPNFDYYQINGEERISAKKNKATIDSLIDAATPMNWPQWARLDDDEEITLTLNEKRPIPGWVPLATIVREQWCYQSGQNTEIADAMSYYSPWRGWAWHERSEQAEAPNKIYAFWNGQYTMKGRKIPSLFSTEDMIPITTITSSLLYDDPNVWPPKHKNEINAAFKIKQPHPKHKDVFTITLHGEDFNLIDITPYVSGQYRFKQKIVNLDFIEKFYYPNPEMRGGWQFYYLKEAEERIKSLQEGSELGISSYRKAVLEYSKISDDIKALITTYLLYAIEEGEIGTDAGKLQEARTTELAQSWNDIVYFAGAPELRLIGITCDHVHDATDEGRAPPGMKNLFPKIKVKAHIDILTYIKNFFSNYDDYKARIENDGVPQIEKNLFKRSVHEMLLLLEEYLQRPTFQIKDQVMKDVWNKILENTNSMSMYITCSIPPRGGSSANTTINKISIIPSAIKAKIIINQDLKKNKRWLQNMMQQELIATNNTSNFFAKIRHRIMGLISNGNPQNLFPDNIRSILEKGNIIIINNTQTDGIKFEEYKLDIDVATLEMKAEVSEQAGADVTEAWGTIFRLCQPGQEGFNARTEALGEKKNVMLSDMLTGLVADSTLIEGLNEAGIFEGPISVGNDACVAIPPTPSLNDHAASMHCAGRKRRRKITVNSIIPHFKYDSITSTEDRMNLAFANNITLHQQNPIYQDKSDININMNRSLYGLNDSRKYSMLFGEDFSNYIELHTCGVKKKGKKTTKCGACQNGAGGEDGRTNTIFTYNDAVQNYLPTMRSEGGKWKKGRSGSIFTLTGGNLQMKSSLPAQSLCDCHLYRVFDNADEYIRSVEEEEGDKASAIEINTPDRLIGIKDEGGDEYEDTMDATGVNFKSIIKDKMSQSNKYLQQSDTLEALELREPKPCTQLCLCKGLCWGNILIASEAVKKIDKIFTQESEMKRCGWNINLQKIHKDIKRLVINNKEEVYCLINILLTKFNAKAETILENRCNKALEYINEITGIDMDSMILGRFLEIFLHISQFDFNGGLDFYTFVRSADGPGVLKKKVELEEARSAEDTEVSRDDIMYIFKKAFLTVLEDKYQKLSVGDDAQKKEYEMKLDLANKFVWIPDFQLLLLSTFTSLINLNNSTLGTGGSIHKHGINLTIPNPKNKVVVCYPSTAAAPMMKSCMTQLQHPNTYETFNADINQDQKVYNYWASKLSKWSGDAHQNMMGKICGYLLMSSDEISFMSTRLVKGSRLCSAIEHENDAEKMLDTLQTYANFKTGDDAQETACTECGCLKTKKKQSGRSGVGMTPEQRDLHEQLYNEIKNTFRGNNKFFHCYYSGEKSGQEATLFLHLFRLGDSEDIEEAKRKTQDELNLGGKGTGWKIIIQALESKIRKKVKLIKGSKKGSTIKDKDSEYTGKKAKSAGRAVKKKKKKKRK